MMTYATLQSDRREFLALTGLTLQEFQLLLNAFTPAYERRYPKDRTLADRPRQRCAGGGRKGVLDCPEQKLLFLLVYLKTYPLQVLMGELFGLSQPGVNYWIHRLLPVLRDALDSLSVLPERNPNDFARSQTATGTEPRLIIDGTERRRQRPKSPEKQALHYSGKKKAHTDKNVVIVDLRRKCIGFLSRTYVGKTHDKKIADSEGISDRHGFWGGRRLRRFSRGAEVSVSKSELLVDVQVERTDFSSADICSAKPPAVPEAVKRHRKTPGGRVLQGFHEPPPKSVTVSSFPVVHPFPEQEGPPHAARRTVIPAGHGRINQMDTRNRYGRTS